jgi:hypothetical protein
MVVCDLCGQRTECFQRAIEGKRYDICSDCWSPLTKKLEGKGKQNESQKKSLVKEAEEFMVRVLNRAAHFAFLEKFPSAFVLRIFGVANLVLCLSRQRKDRRRRATIFLMNFSDEVRRKVLVGK